MTPLLSTFQVQVPTVQIVDHDYGKVLDHQTPYCFRVEARLAEPRIAEAQQGTAVGDGEQGWEELLVRLRSVSKEHQEVFVLTCTEDHTDPDVADALGCDEDTAKLRRENTMNLLRELSESIVAPTQREHTDEGAH